ncbi:YfhO family protein [Phytohabitans flavus]|uniref:Uncharacterized protein n=3 Tax=Phytohabitans flavus TaxID=1076124 RepID=A0A6F8XTZ4_9ACTN|nr:hypothetical protein Pflav_037140 [Phytohabitans flavus]
MNFATSPTLDRMSIRYGVSTLDSPVPGAPRPAPATTGVTTLMPETPVTLPVPGTGPIRAVQLQPAEDLRWAPTERLEAVLTDETGREVARTDRRIDRTNTTRPTTIPLAAEGVAPDARLSVKITVHASQGIKVNAVGNAPALAAVGAQDDGLKMAFVGDATVIERTKALPRARWASTAVVEPDGARRMELLRSGTLTADQVVLDHRPRSEAAGGTGDVKITEEGTDATEVTVTARGSGYLVLTDPIQTGWTVTVDGTPATLLNADHAFVAVEIPDGSHTVRFQYSSPGGGIGGWLSLAAALAIVAVLVGGAVRDRRRRALRSSGPVPTDL